MKKQSNHHGISNQTILGGALIGTAIGVGATYLMSNSGKSLRHTLSKLCCDVSDQAQELAEQLAEKTEEFSEEASCYFQGKKRAPEHLNWIVGGVACGVLAVSAVAFMTHSSTKEARDSLLENFESLTNKTYQFADSVEEGAHEVAENFEDHVTCWVKTAHKFLNGLNSNAKKAYEKMPHNKESTIDKVADWAIFGLKIYQSLKK